MRTISFDDLSETKNSLGDDGPLRYVVSAIRDAGVGSELIDDRSSACQVAWTDARPAEQGSARVVPDLCVGDGRPAPRLVVLELAAVQRWRRRHDSDSPLGDGRVA